MMVSVESGSGLERRMRVQVPAESIEKEIESRLHSIGKKAKLKGFRPGKAPLHVIRKQYGPQVRKEVLSEMIQSSYSEAVGQGKTAPCGWAAY